MLKSPLGAASLLALLLGGPIFAQSPPASMIPKHPPPGWVDGSKHPELIPDKAAFRLVFLNLQAPPVSSRAMNTKQDAKFRKIGLSDPDKAVTQQIIAQFAMQHAQWVSAWTPAGSVSPQLNAQVEALVEQTRAAFAEHLTADGNAKFRQYVQRMKSRMVVKP